MSYFTLLVLNVLPIKLAKFQASTLRLMKDCPANDICNIQSTA